MTLAGEGPLSNGVPLAIGGDERSMPVPPRVSRPCAYPNDTLRMRRPQ